MWVSTIFQCTLKKRERWSSSLYCSRSNSAAYRTEISPELRRRRWDSELRDQRTTASAAMSSCFSVIDKGFENQCGIAEILEVGLRETESFFTYDKLWITLLEPALIDSLKASWFLAMPKWISSNSCYTLPRLLERSYWGTLLFW